MVRQSEMIFFFNDFFWKVKWIFKSEMYFCEKWITFLFKSEMYFFLKSEIIF